jgi:maltooligosyltrehalose trehalohydrolase
MTALTLLSPSTPLLFAGEEFGATTPFLYFADWDGELGQQVTEGRAKEFAHFMEGTEGDAQVPPACEVNTFEACRLDWQAAQDPQAVAWRAFVSAALAVRRECFTSRVAGLIPGAHVTHMLGERCFVLRWRYDGGAVIQLEANLSGEAVTPLGLASRPWPALHDEHEIFNVKRHADAGQAWPAWSGRWTLGHEESTVTRLPSRS